MSDNQHSVTVNVNRQSYTFPSPQNFSRRAARSHFRKNMAKINGDGFLWNLTDHCPESKKKELASILFEWGDVGRELARAASTKSYASIGSAFACVGAAIAVMTLASDSSSCGAVLFGAGLVMGGSIFNAVKSVVDGSSYCLYADHLQNAAGRLDENRKPCKHQEPMRFAIA